MPRILVADDDLQQLQVQKRLLEALGNEVDVASSPPETLLRVGEGKADLIVMDLRFPNASGHSDAGEGMALIRAIREAGCRLPLIVLSGWPDDLYGSPEEKMVSRIMVKPVGLMVLLRTITELLG